MEKRMREKHMRKKELKRQEREVERRRVGSLVTTLRELFEDFMLHTVCVHVFGVQTPNVHSNRFPNPLHLCLTPWM